jgi:hypothetical protein
MRMFPRAIVLFLLAVSPATVVAQTAPLVDVGARVRVHAQTLQSWRIGRVVEVDTSRLVLTSWGGENREEFPLRFVQKLEVSQGRTGAQERTVVGALVGALLGGAIGGMIGNSRAEGLDFDPGLQGALIGALLGGALGAYAGSSSTPEAWVEVPLRR